MKPTWLVNYNNDAGHCWSIHELKPGQTLKPMLEFIFESNSVWPQYEYHLRLIVFKDERKMSPDEWPLWDRGSIVFLTFLPFDVHVILLTRSPTSHPWTHWTISATYVRGKQRPEEKNRRPQANTSALKGKPASARGTDAHNDVKLIV